MRIRTLRDRREKTHWSMKQKLTFKLPLTQSSLIEREVFVLVNVICKKKKERKKTDGES